MITETEQVEAVYWAGRRFNNKDAREAIALASPEAIHDELSLLGHIVRGINYFRSYALAATWMFGDYDNIAKLPTQLPNPTALRTPSEKLHWRLTLGRTVRVFDQEIGNYYTNPGLVPAEDLLRFLTIDGYGRSVAIDKLGRKNPVEQRGLAETVVNSVCEGAILQAERKSKVAQDLVRWLVKTKWLEQGFNPAIVARAQVFAE